MWKNGVYVQFKMWPWTWWSVATDLRGSWQLNLQLLSALQSFDGHGIISSSSKQTQLETSWWTSRSQIFPAGFAEPLDLSGAQMHDSKWTAVCLCICSAAFHADWNIHHGDWWEDRHTRLPTYHNSTHHTTSFYTSGAKYHVGVLSLKVDFKDTFLLHHRPPA